MVRFVVSVVIPALAAVLFLASVSARADYEAGQRAWDAGDPAAALTEWLAAADRGDRQAMRALGRLYRRGVGTPQDYVEAHMWFNLAAARGDAAAADERDALAAEMTPEERAEARKRAREWRSGADTAAKTEAPAASPASSPADGPPPQAVREAQALLAALGYAPGPADGMWGERTGEAHRAFLADVGLPPADTLTPEALQAMRDTAARHGAAAPPEVSRRAAPSPPPEAPRRAAPSPPPDAPPQSPPPRAALAGDIDGLEAALAAGANPNARDGRGRTALMHAANEGYPLLVPTLLAAGADPDIRAADGATALFMAAVHGHSEIVALLMEAGADPRIKGPKGMTAVDAARLTWGDAAAARRKGESSPVLALLEGRTWREVDDTAFARAKAAGTAEAYEEYLSSHPKGFHADEAGSAADDAAFALAKRVGTTEAYEEYLSSRPEGRHADGARSAADDAAFALAKAVGTAEAYEGYLSSRPEGRHADEARSAADGAAFALAKRMGTTEAYEEYLSSRPEGRHADEARSAADDAAEQAEVFARRLGRPFRASWKDEATGWTDLHFAALLDLPAAAAALIGAGRKPDSPLNGNGVPFGEELARTLAGLHPGEDWSDWEADGETPLMIAALADSGEAASALMSLTEDMTGLCTN